MGLVSEALLDLLWKRAWAHCTLGTLQVQGNRGNSLDQSYPAPSKPWTCARGSQTLLERGMLGEDEQSRV